MSYIQETASTSSSPSKTSPKSHHRLSRSLLPSPHFEEHTHTIEASAVVGQFDFQPFFALIENSSTSEHHHPTIHYIFADDDAEIVTEAACRALAQHEPQHVVSEDEENKLPAPVDGVHEHYILLDVQPGEAGDGYRVTRAHSMSSEWQVITASISNAPTMNPDDTKPGEGLMLKVEGMSATRQAGSEEAGKTKKETLQQMMGKLEKGLAEIRKMVDEGKN